MFSKFLHRPALAIVISLLILLMGVAVGARQAQPAAAYAVSGAANTGISR